MCGQGEGGAWDVLEERRGEGGSGTQNLVYQKWPTSIFLFVKFIFSRNEIWV